MSFITLAELKTYLDISGSDQDDKLQDIIDGVQGSIETYIGYKLESQTYTERYNGSGNTDVVLNHPVVTSLTSFEYNEGTIGNPTRTAFDTDDYYLDTDISMIHTNFNVFCGHKNIKIVYIAGYTSSPDTRPGDLVLANLLYSASIYNSGDGITEERVDNAYLKFSSESIPLNVLAIINNYKNVIIPS